MSTIDPAFDSEFAVERPGHEAEVILGTLWKRDGGWGFTPLPQSRDADLSGGVLRSVRFGTRYRVVGLHWPERLKMAAGEPNAPAWNLEVVE